MPILTLLILPICSHLAMPFNNLELLLLIMFQNKIISPFSDQDIHVTQLNKFQNGKEKKYGMNPVFTDFDDFFKWNRFSRLTRSIRYCLLVLNGVIILNNSMPGLIVTFLQAHQYLFKSLHQFK